MRNRANGTAPKANKLNPHAEKLPSSVKVAISEQHTRRILRHLFSEELIIRQDQKNGNGRPNHLYGSKKPS